MPFVKLDCNIVDSTLWVDRDGREVFITALLMASPKEFKEPVPQISVDNTDLTGFVAPAGWYGFVPASGPGIVRRAMVDPDAGKDALRMLGSPDPGSRSSDYEGRRMIRIDGGYLILNYIKYREKDHTAAERMRRYRSSKKESVTRNVDNVHRNVTQAYAEAEAYGEESLAPSQKPITEAKPKEKKEHTRAKRASLTPMPENFGISDRVRDWAERNDFARLDDHLEHFVTVSKARAYVYADWDAAFMTAIRKDWAGLRSPGQSQTIKPPVGKTATAISKLQGMKNGNERFDLESDAAPVMPRLGGPARR